MSDWIVERDDEGNSKIRPSFPECPFKDTNGQLCGGNVVQMGPGHLYYDSDCGTLIQRISGEQEACNDKATLFCEKCLVIACEECFKGNWFNR